MVNNIQVIEKSGQLWTTSREVAGKFGKRHDTVLRTIRNLECSDDFRRHNFAESCYLNEQGKEQHEFLLSRGGFSMVAIAFTGREAVAWKERFLAAFDAMEKRIIQLSRQAERRGQIEWQQARHEGKHARVGLAAVLVEFVAYAKNQGSAHASSYHTNISRMIYRTFFGLSPALERQLRPNIRQHLDLRQLRDLAMVEDRLALEMADHMATGMPYKSIFKQAQAFVEALAQVLKPSPVTPLAIGKAVTTKRKGQASGVEVQLTLWDKPVSKVG